MTFVVVANLDDLEVGDTMLVSELREPISRIRIVTQSSYSRFLLGGKSRENTGCSTNCFGS